MSTPSSVYAGFWLRVGASLIDQVIVIGALLVLLMAIVFSAQGPSILTILSFFVLWLLSFIGPWLYSALFESSVMQATPGKKAVGIKVTDLEGNRIAFGRATGRHFAEWITGMTFFIGYVMVAFTQKRQSLHDMIAGTVVVAADAVPAAVAAAEPAKPMHPLAIVGIVLLGLVPIAGLLAAIAIPAYQDFTARAQVTEGLVLANDLKSQVALLAETESRWPADAADAGVDTGIQIALDSARYVDSLAIAKGTITITYGREAESRLRRKRLSLRPYVSADGEVKWLCGRAAEPPDASFGFDEPGNGSASERGTTSVPDKLLPASCRAGYIPEDEDYPS